MFSINPLITWSLYLGFALFAPIGLPAGGAEILQPAIRKRIHSDPHALTKRCSLYSYPISKAPISSVLNFGNSVRILRTWKSDEGEIWLYVEKASYSFLDSPVHRQRGWLNA
tara:strand:- start:3702 stop:4037 length:336 start_codon:yes stop_codon:yes gene_type:complete